MFTRLSGMSGMSRFGMELSAKYSNYAKTASETVGHGSNWLPHPVFLPPEEGFLAVPPCQTNEYGLFCIFQAVPRPCLARLEEWVSTNVYRVSHGGTVRKKRREFTAKSGTSDG
jgi:hypothetical protein